MLVPANTVGVVVDLDEGINVQWDIGRRRPELHEIGSRWGHFNGEVVPAYSQARRRRSIPGQIDILTDEDTDAMTADELLDALTDALGNMPAERVEFHLNRLAAA